jgi:hypothetical protein
MAETLTIRTASSTEVIKVAVQGPQGPAGANGQGVPVGGSTGQVLRKASGTDYDTEWAAAGSGSGSVTSVAISGSDGIEIDSGSPITSSGTIALGVNAATLRSHINVADGAEANVNPDWNAASGDAQILNKPTLGGAAALNVGTTAGTVAAGDDARFTDNRDPNAHAASHAAAGSDPIEADSLASTNTGSANALLIADGSGGTSWDTAANVFTQEVSPADIGAAAATHSHDASDITSGSFGNISFDGKLGSTSGLPLVTTTAGAVTTLALGTAGQVLRTKSDLSGVEFADPAAAGVTSVTGTAPIVSSGGTTPAISVTVGTGANTVAAGNDSRITGAIQSTLVDAKGDLIVATAADTVARLPVGATNGHVLTVDSAEAGGMKWAAASGGVSNVDSTLADVMSVSGSNLVADDGGLVDSSNPVLTWDDAAGKAVWANPLRRTSSGAFYVGLAPTTTALGSNAVNVQGSRAAATQVASGDNSVSVGTSARASGSISTAIGLDSIASGGNGVAIGRGAAASGNDTSCFGRGATAQAAGSTAIGFNSFVTATNASAVGNSVVSDLRAQFATAPFSAVFWSGQTTNNTATILNLDGTATNRFTIAASTALAVDILLVARRSDVADKWLVARRFLGIRRDGSNNTSLIGAVQTLGTDQSAGSPTWTFTLTADDTNEALQLEVTGATSETVQWRATAIYRVV